MKIICNTPGKGREENPYESIKTDAWGTEWDAFEENVKELPAYHSDHTTPLPVGEWDVKLKHQVIGCSWYDVDLAVYNRMDQRYTRQIYISPLPPAQTVKAVEEEVNKNDWDSFSRSDLDSAKQLASLILKDCHPIETPAIATSEVQRVIGDTSFVHLTDGWVQIVTKNGAVDLAPEELTELTSFILKTHVPVDEVEKIKSVLKQIRRVELLTPETEALINKILNP